MTQLRACFALTEVLDIDCILFVPPQTRFKLAGTKFRVKPLKFRNIRHRDQAGPRKLYLRLKFNHFIVYIPSGAEASISAGAAANEDHYLDGTHDVATGMCGPWCRCKVGIPVVPHAATLDITRDITFKREICRT